MLARAFLTTAWFASNRSQTITKKPKMPPSRKRKRHEAEPSASQDERLPNSSTMNAATRMFSIPELCGLVFNNFDDIEIFRLQNITRGVRQHLQRHRPWNCSISHREACNILYTVKPEADEDDPKKAIWKYTSGLQIGERLPKMKKDKFGHRGPRVVSRLPTVYQSSSATTTQAGTFHQSNPAPPIATSNASTSANIGSTHPGKLRLAALRHHFPKADQWDPAPSPCPTQKQAVTLNWLLEAKMPRWSYYPHCNMMLFEEKVPMEAFFTNSYASYRPLLLMTPPLSEVKVVDCNGSSIDVKNDKGVTMGDVVDALLGEGET